MLKVLIYIKLETREQSQSHTSFYSRKRDGNTFVTSTPFINQSHAAKFSHFSPIQVLLEKHASSIHCTESLPRRRAQFRLWFHIIITLFCVRCTVCFLSCSPALSALRVPHLHCANARAARPERCANEILGTSQCK